MAAAIRRLLQDDVFYGECVSSLARVRPRFAWDVVMQPLIEVIRQWQKQSCIDSLPAHIDLSIVVVTWNSERWIDRCLRAIPAACGAIQHEVILYDNASSDPTLSVAQALLPAHILESKSNDGLGRGDQSRHPRLSRTLRLPLDSLLRLEPNSLATLIEFLDSHPDVAAAAPLLSDDGRSQRDFQLWCLPLPPASRRRSWRSTN